MEIMKESPQENESKILPLEALKPYLLTMFIVAAATAIFLFIGRNVLGEGVIALLYLAPISWVAARWGQGPGTLAAVASALAFDYLFIPPFYTLTVGNLEGWLLLGIFLVVAIVIVERIQVGLKQAQEREHEAIFMYELSHDLATARSPEAITYALAAKVQQYYQAKLVQAVIHAGDAPVSANVPANSEAKGKPDLIIPILATKDLMGEVRIWAGLVPLPSEPDRLLRGLTNQSALAMERVQL